VLARLDVVIEAGLQTVPARPVPARPVPIRLRRVSARKPRLLLYCQHAVGLGHLTRSAALAGALSDRFDVVVLSGGVVPPWFSAPTGVRLVALPPLVLAPEGGLRSADRRQTLPRVKQRRARMIADAVQATRPSVVVVELFPFGRRAFTEEIVTMLEQSRALSATDPIVACSVRDILVRRGSDQAGFDERACRLANRHFDAILVHADPRFARLEESFRPRTPLRVPVHHTGFVSASPSPPPGRESSSERVLVSAGGGRVGEPLLQAAIEAQPLVSCELSMGMQVIAGPFLDQPAWRRLRARASGCRGLTVRRSVADLSAELQLSAVSVSQCGYNTTLEVLRARVPALVVPYVAPGEDEQLRRAERLAGVGALRMLDPKRLSGRRLATQIAELTSSPPEPIDLDLEGASRSSELLWQLLRERSHPAGEAARA
jgi:predicted glycosyltransferase